MLQPCVHHICLCDVSVGDSVKLGAGHLLVLADISELIVASVAQSSAQNETYHCCRHV